MSGRSPGAAGVPKLQPPAAAGKDGTAAGGVSDAPPKTKPLL